MWRRCYPLKISFVAGLKYNTFVGTPPSGTCRIGLTKKPAAAGLRGKPDAFKHIELATEEF